MNRRDFVGSGFAVSAAAQTAGSGTAAIDYSVYSQLVVDRKREGKPGSGKVLAVIQPHSDDFTIFNGGLVAKLIDEGYKAYLIRVTNDDSAGPGSVGNTVLENEKDNERLVKTFGFAGQFSLNYPNHNMDNTSRGELKSRFIFLFRLLQVDTIITYSPWGHYEENPDHYVTAMCVEAACWMAGGDKDYPEHFAAGLKPKSVREKYYYGRFDWRINRVVDIGPWVERKIDGLLENKAQGPAGEAGAALRKRLAAQGMKLPVLGNSDQEANRNYIREFVLRRNRELGKQYGLEFAEPYLYIGPEPDIVEEYVRNNAVRL